MSTKHRVSSPNILIAWLAFQVPALCQAPPPGSESLELPFVYQTWQTFTTREGLPHNNILAIYVSGEQVWAGTEGGLALREGNAWKSWTAREGLPWPAITAIDIDARTHDMWLGTWGGGLVRLSGGRFHQFNQLNSGLAGNMVFALAALGDRVWVSTNGGLSSFDTANNTWDLYFERRADEPETVITNLSFDDRYLYAAAWCGPLHRFDLGQGTWSIAKPANSKMCYLPPSPDSTALGIAASDRSLWWTTQTNLLRRDSDGRWETRRIGGQQASGNFVHCIAAPDEQSAWLGTDQCLEVLADWSTSTWVRYRRCENGSEGRVTVSRNGRILDDRILDSAIPDNRIRCIAFQGDDVWVGTSRGLARGIGRGWLTGLRAVPQTDAPPKETTCTPAGDVATAPTLSDVKPEQLQVVNIAVLRPGDRAIAVPGSDSPVIPRLGQMDRLAVHLAIEQANARGGYRGKIPFALTTGPVGFFSGWGWTTPEDDFPALANQPNAWGIVGHLGPDSCITSAVALRTEVPLVNFASTPATIDEIINPWIFRCRGEGPRQHQLLLDYIFDRLGYTRLAMLRSPGRLAQMHLDWWSSHAQDRGHPVVADLDYDPETDDLSSQLRALRRSRTEVVLTWCDAPTSATILRRMRKAGMDILFVGSDQIVNDEFIGLIGRKPGAVIAACLQASHVNRQVTARFAEDYEARFKRPPSPDAYLTFEAANHLIEAINTAGLNREAIRQTLHKMSHHANGERHCEQMPYGLDDIILERLSRRAGSKWQPYTIFGPAFHEQPVKP